MKSNLQHEKLISPLWEELIKLSPGDKFLSIREIMKRYSVSQPTVEKALLRFREDGYLNNRSGKGLFASAMISKFNKEIAPTYLLVVPQWISTDINILEYTVNAEKDKYPNNRLLVHKFDVSNNIPPQLPIQEENVVGIIILPTGGTLSVKDLQTIETYSQPVIVLGRHLDDFNISCVGTDDTFSGNLAVHHLIENGHKKIAILLSEPHNQIIMNRVKAICDYAELQGISTEIIDCEVQNDEHPGDKTYRKFSEVIQRGFDFTAIAGIDGESMQEAVNVCLNSGIKIPEDLSMIAIAAESVSERFHPQIDAVAVNFSLQVEKALQFLDAQVHGIKSEDHDLFVRPHIIDRGSVKKLNNI